MNPEGFKEVTGVDTPYLLIDKNVIVDKYKSLKKSIEKVNIFYAVKANDDIGILKTLLREGGGFDVASSNELKKLKLLNVGSNKLVCFHTIKSQQFIRELRTYGVDLLAVDSKEEVDKIVDLFPKAKLVFRLNVDNFGSDWPLTKKFGLNFEDLVELVSYSLDQKLNVYGITFHVGSQCRSLKNWENALRVSGKLWKQCRSMGAKLQLLSLGGGIPIKQEVEVPSIGEIGRTIRSSIRKFFPRDQISKLSIEPGRGLVGDSGNIVSTVVGTALREGKKWVYLDVGVFNGLMETIENYRYEVRANIKGPMEIVTLAGPSCDSVDVIMEGVGLPKVTVGDKIFIINCAAYTTVYAASFNGFPVPKVVYNQ